MITKRNILRLAVTAVMSIAALTAFAQEDKQAAEARKDIAEAEKSVRDAKSELRQAKIDSAADYNMFKTSAGMRITKNRKEIAALKARKAKDIKQEKTKYDESVLALETRNNDLNRRIEESGSTEVGKWSTFKREFNHDMDELKQAFKDIAKDNTK
jgi:hypothetical protein